MQRLPAIYKEMAYELYVDTLDLRVYSARKGRMWRTPNVRRENGRFKVPITPDELMNMTVADYALLCSAPREAPAIAPPTLSQKLAVLYARAASKVEAASKRRKDAKKDFELLARFKGAYPPSLLKVMAGEAAADVGFHKIALQIAITANALGKTEEQMLAACEGLIANHVSDGTRYNSPAKRRSELSRLYTYTQGNPCYEYSRDAVRRLVPAGVAAPDLDGLPVEVTGEVTVAAEDDYGDGGQKAHRAVGQPSCDVAPPAFWAMSVSGLALPTTGLTRSASFLRNPASVPKRQQRHSELSSRSARPSGFSAGKMGEKLEREPKGALY